MPTQSTLPRMSSEVRARFMERVRNASMPAGSPCCGRPEMCSMTHKGCVHLVHPEKRARLYGDPAVTCRGACVRPHPVSGRPVNMRCVLPNGHDGECDCRPMERNGEGDATTAWPWRWDGELKRWVPHDSEEEC